MDLFQLVLRITTAGVKEAVRGLGDVDNAGKKAGTTLATVEARGVAAGRGIAAAGRSATATAAQLTIATTATRALRGALLLFGGGAALTAAVTIGLKAITAAYHFLAEGANRASEATKALADQLDRAAKSRFEATIVGKQAAAMAALNEELKAQKALQDVGPRWFGNRNLFDRAKANLDLWTNRRIEADHQVTEAEEKAAAKQVTAIDRVTRAHLRAGRAASDRIDLPNVRRLDFEGLSQFEPTEGEGDTTLPQESAALAAIFAARQAARDAALAAAEEAERVAQMMQERLADIFSSALINGLTQGFTDGGITGAIKQLGATILQGLGSILVEIGRKAIAASAIMKALASALAKINPWVAAAAGIALIALGNSMGGRGGSGGGGFGGGFGGNVGRGSEEITRYKFIDRQGNLMEMTPRPNLTFNVIGPNDPTAQRAIGTIVEKYSRRQG